ncbi:MAG TPA: nuclear transport factor 2 family protein [Blastocatellia bacterium]
MKQQFLLPLLLLMSALAAAGQPTAPQTPPLTKAEQEVMSQNQAYCDAIVKGDVERLKQILADDFIITSGDGNLRDKAAELKDLSPTEDLKTLFFRTEDTRLRVYADSAVLVGRLVWRINYKGREIDNERRFTSVFVKQKGVWQIVAQQVTRVPQRQQPK